MRSTTAARSSASPESATRPSGGPARFTPCSGRTATSPTSATSGRTCGTRPWQSTKRARSWGSPAWPAVSWGAFQWTEEGGIQPLGTLREDHVHGEAWDINERGQAVGLSCDASFADCRAVLWHDGAMTDLNDLVVPGYANHLRTRPRHQRLRDDHRPSRGPGHRRAARLPGDSDPGRRAGRRLTPFRPRLDTITAGWEHSPSARPRRVRARGPRADNRPGRTRGRTRTGPRARRS